MEKIKKIIKDEKKFTALLAVFAVIIGVSLALMFPLDIFGRPNNFNPSNISDGNPSKDNGGKLSGLFDSSSSWSTSEGWKGVGVSIHEGKIVNDKFTIKKGQDFAHYGKRFMNQNFNQIKVTIDLPDGYKGECGLNLATGSKSQKDKIMHFNFGGADLKDKKKYSLKDGENIFDISDIKWGKFSYLKVTLSMDNSSEMKPYINEVSIK